MRGVWASIGLCAFISAAPIGQSQAQAQSGIIDLGTRLAVLHTLSVVSTVDSSVPGGKTAADRVEQAAQTMRIMGLMKSDSLDQVIATYSPGASVILPDGGTLNVSDLRGWFSEALARLSVLRNTLRLDPSGVQIIGDHAVATGFVVTELSDKSGQVSHVSVFTDFKLLFIKEDGRWRVLRHSFSAPKGSWSTAN